MTTPSYTLSLNDLCDAVDKLSLAKSNLEQLDSLFSTIRQYCQKGSYASRLADIGQYLCADWANGLDYTLGPIEAAWNAARQQPEESA